LLRVQDFGILRDERGGPQWLKKTPRIKPAKRILQASRGHPAQQTARSGVHSGQASHASQPPDSRDSGIAHPEDAHTDRIVVSVFVDCGLAARKEWIASNKISAFEIFALRIWALGHYQ